ncbi:hypothetical protein [Embleya sp. NPDC059237]|uniref:hypothetical protein n=1 Tax=Embleya sp. NPDC059237 TaxID=3346784 RepID=UPI00369839B2
MNAAALVIALAATLAGCGHLACASGMRRAVDVVLLWLLLTTAQLSALTMLVGALLRRLHAVPLFVAALVVAVVEIAATRRARVDGERRRGRDLVRALAPRVRRSWRHPAVVVVAVLVVAQYCWRGALAVFLGPLDYDGLWYHLPGPAIWLQQGYVGHTPQVLWADVYPQGQELLTGFTGAFLGDTRLGWASGLPFLALGAVATAGIARTAGARRAHATLAGLGILAVPAVFLEASTTYVDFATTATALAALHLTLGLRSTVVAAITRGVDPPRALRRQVWWIAIALGVAVGVKSSNLLTAAMVGVLVVVQTGYVLADVRRGAPSGPPRGRVAGLRGDVAALVRAAMPNVALLGLAMTALGGYWYLRTWIRYGNPFYPFSMFGFPGRGTVDELIIRTTISPLVIGEGKARATWHSWLLDRERFAYTYDQQPGGFGLQWIYLLLPVLVVGLVLFGVRRRFDLLWGLVLPVIVWGIASPAPWWARYQLIVPALGCVGLAVVLTALAERSDRARGGRMAVPMSARRAVAGLLAAVFVGTTAVSMWWATQPTNTWTGDRFGAHRANVREAVELMRDPDRDRRILPTAAYAGLDRVPDGRTIAFTDFTRADFLHLIMGERGQRRITNLGEPRDVADFTRRLRASGAQYLLLGVANGDRDLLLAVLGDRGHYRPVVRGNGGIGWFGGGFGGAELFEVGDFTRDLCANREPDLAVTARDAGTVAVVLRDACGAPLFEVDVVLLGAGGEVARVMTGARGEAVLRVPDSVAGQPVRVLFAGDGYYGPVEAEAGG